MISEFAISVDEPVEVRVRKLTVGVRDAREKMDRVQLELNLQIAKLQLKDQPSTLLDVKEHRTISIKTVMAVINSVVIDCMKLSEQSFEVLTTLPTLQRSSQSWEVFTQRSSH